MTKTNAAGSALTILGLCTLLVYCIWRIYRLEEKLIDCYQTQLENIVTIDTSPK